jgi:hydroxyacylglutathione hydrolase
MLEVKQIATAAFELLSYIIRDPLTGESLVIDPPSGIKSHIDSQTMNIKAVINTHLHPDHTLGNSFFGGKVPIRVHPGDSGFIMRAFNSVFSTLSTAKFPPRISFDLEDKSTILLGDTSIVVMHTPGHSPGSICLYWPGNLISGDTIFVGNIGRTDIPGGNPQKLQESIQKIMTLPPDTVIWPGHHYMDTFTSTLSRESSFLNRVMDILG